MSGRLAGKVAIVTGAGSGIGEATARAFASEGAKVAVLDVNGTNAQKVSDSINKAGWESIPIVADVSAARDVELAVSQVVGKWNRLDILVNNAAVQIMGRVHEYSEADFDRTIDVNLKGVFLGCRYVLPVMMEQKKGVILSTSSVLGTVGDPDLAVYGATKGGIIALTKSLAVAYGPSGIRAIAVCPGDVNTPLVKEYFDFQADPDLARQRVNAEYPLRRIAEPDEIARVFVFLASDDASFISGSEIYVDGGLLAQVY
jgi:NAD(P)-dependent dehydrogenase (short-subunit alcohol dehydrogenase family)